MVPIYKVILLSSQKEWNNAICSSKDATRDYHTKLSDRERQISYDITCMWNVKYGTNKLSMKQNKLTGREIRLMVAKGERERKKDELGNWGW